MGTLQRIYQYMGGHQKLEEQVQWDGYTELNKVLGVGEGKVRCVTLKFKNKND